MTKDYAAYEARRLQPVFDALGQAAQDFEKADQQLKQANQANNEAAQKSARREKDAANKRIEANNRVLATECPTLAFHWVSTTEIAKPEGVRQFWQERTLREPSAIADALIDEGLEPLLQLLAQPLVSVEEMPLFSFHLSFRFRLIKPFLSRDDDDFYVIENPVKKDKVLKLPYVSPSSWKGALRNATRYNPGSNPEAEVDNEKIERLFGIDKRNQERVEKNDFNAGRLRFFPTFFRQIGLEVINPHLRQTGAGDKPILFETALGEGQFNLLYFPFNLSATAAHEAMEDLVNVVTAVEAMFTAYGFGAKTNNGFGSGEVVTVKQKNVDYPNTLTLRFPEEVEKTLDVAFGGGQSFGSFRMIEKKSKQKALHEERKEKVLSPISVRSFNSFGELKTAAKLLAVKIDPTGGWKK